MLSWIALILFWLGILILVGPFMILLGKGFYRAWKETVLELFGREDR